jgi:arginyl-tRNA synthetase
MNLENILSQKVKEGLLVLYNNNYNQAITFQKTRPEFSGDITLVTFPFLKISGKGPEQTALELGNYLKENCKEVADFNVIKGFLNIEISANYWLDFFKTISQNKKFGFAEKESGKTIMVEYSSPNTNKPLHLGHIRNNLLGYSVAEILKANGHKVIKANLINDRGIHICKSMLAWKKWGNGETPENTGIKGDHLVGKYYVEFDKHYKTEINELISKGISKEEAEKQAPIMQEVQEMLRKWEAGDEETLSLWKMMNEWVYEGFEKTYKALGIDFDKIYYESQTYLLGKNMVEEGLQKGVFYKKDDGSVWIDLTAEGLDHKLLLRSDGTSVYITQDIGTAIERFKEFPQLDGLIYTVGNEQDYHFKVLFLILDKLGYKQAKNCYHLSYGMVELPHGKMKSREGTVVDADDLIEEMIQTAAEKSKERGKTENMNEAELNELNKMIGLAALKYFILKVDPKKKMLFNPEESIDMNGNTGPFIQYTHARIRSLIRKAKELFNNYASVSTSLPGKEEISLLKQLYYFPQVITESGEKYDPSHIANYIYDLAKQFNQYYADVAILKEENESLKALRIQLSEAVGNIIKNGMQLLGINVPEKM